MAATGKRGSDVAHPKQKRTKNEDCSQPTLQDFEKRAIACQMNIQFFSKSKCATERYLSNFTFFGMGIPFSSGGELLSFPTIEHAFQTAKYSTSMSTGDRTSAAFEQLMQTLQNPRTQAADAKTLGGRRSMAAVGFTLVADEWNARSEDIMRQLVRARAGVDDLYAKILRTAALRMIRFYHFERTGSKSVWGGCVPKSMPLLLGLPDYSQWQGGNLLGKILSEVGQELLLKEERRKPPPAE